MLSCNMNHVAHILHQVLKDVVCPDESLSGLRLLLPMPQYGLSANWALLLETNDLINGAGVKGGAIWSDI